MTTAACTRVCTAPSRRRTSALSLIIGAFLARRSRRALARLDNDALRDLGLSRRDAATEAARPLWDVPAIWRR